MESYNTSNHLEQATLMNLEDHMIDGRFDLLIVQGIEVEPTVDIKIYFVEKQGLGHNNGLFSTLFGHLGTNDSWEMEWKKSQV